MPLQRRGGALRKHEERVTWLASRPDLYRGVPGINDDVTDAGSIALTGLCDEMRALGLFGSSTVTTQRETVRRLVSELRGEAMKGGHW